MTEVTAAYGRELQAADPSAPIGWPNLPDVTALTLHVGGVHRWVVGVLRSRRPVPMPEVAPVAATALSGWYEDGRRMLLDALSDVPPEAVCWTLGGRHGTAAAWRRRMVHENLKHLVDLRAAGGRPLRSGDELAPADLADGVDELFTEFLPRSRPSLAPLPGPVVLEATDVARRWRIGAAWDVTTDDPEAGGGTRVLARAGDLALAVCERADPVVDADRFRVEGDPAAAAALRAAPIHPW